MLWKLIGPRGNDKQLINAMPAYTCIAMLGIIACWSLATGGDTFWRRSSGSLHINRYNVFQNLKWFTDNTGNLSFVSARDFQIFAHQNGVSSCIKLRYIFINCFQSSGLLSFENLGWWFILSCVSLPTWLIDDSVSLATLMVALKSYFEMTSQQSLGPFWLEI